MSGAEIPRIVEYEGRSWRVLHDDGKAVVLCPKGERPTTENMRRIGRHVLAVQLDPPEKARPIDERRWRRAHHTGSG